MARAWRSRTRAPRENTELKVAFLALLAVLALEIGIFVKFQTVFV